MQILAVDVGTGTQDVLLFDTSREPENALKLVMPSPTVRLAGAIRAATQAGDDLLLTGVTMGGGPCAWAVEEHLTAGFRVFATAEAAQTFNDDLAEVEAMGIHVVSEDEAEKLGRVRRLVLRDFDYPALDSAFAAFGVDLGRAELLALGVFDHGAAPPGVSDRLFRFEYLAERIRSGRGLAGFAYPRESIPPAMTRLRAAASTAPADRPVLAMDTAPAAVLGAFEDPTVARPDVVVVNVGNFHTLAFHVRAGRIAGLFEHHTGLLTRRRLEELVGQLSAGTISHDELFAEHGHGALVVDPIPARPDVVAVTGPRRGLLVGSGLNPHFAVPYGDMMMSGCWGLVRACAQVLPWTEEAICASLGSARVRV